MGAVVRADIRSPNCDPRPIVVELLVLHATAADLATTLRLLADPEHGASAHLVVAEDGEAYELVPCLTEPARRAWHAGRSRWIEGEGSWENLNDWSIGIELVNRNGNLFAYTDAQYTALARLIDELRGRYPALDDPGRVVGHEHIAGFRGKVDPGFQFDWVRLFREAYPQRRAPARQPVLRSDRRDALGRLAAAASMETRSSHEFWMALSLLTETLCAATSDQER